ncbi:hypothetical protein KRP22_004741 [Phytophthora ramorum]
MVRSFRYAIVVTTAIAIPIANGDRDVPLWWYTRNHSGGRVRERYLGRWVKESSKGREDRKLRSLFDLLRRSFPLQHKWRSLIPGWEVYWPS